MIIHQKNNLKINFEFTINQNTIICEGTPPTILPYVHFMSMEPRKYTHFFKKELLFCKAK